MIQSIGSTARGGKRGSTQKAWYCRQTRCCSGHWAALSGMVLFFVFGAGIGSAQDTMQTAFTVKFVSADAVYLEGGSDCRHLCWIGPGSDVVGL